jgi:hypothetical protein
LPVVLAQGKYASATASQTAVPPASPGSERASLGHSRRETSGSTEAPSRAGKARTQYWRIQNVAPTSAPHAIATGTDTTAPESPRRARSESQRAAASSAGT